MTLPQTTRAALSPLVGIVFLGFLSVGLPLAALALQLHDEMGFDPFWVGIVIGAQSVVTVLTRHLAGTVCDRRGPKRSVLTGLPLAALAGVLMLLATTSLPAGHGLILPAMLVARAFLGAGESFFLTGTMSWGIGRLGPARTGKVMAWQGIAMYAALGIGAPLGLWLMRHAGFGAVVGLAALCPVLACGIALALRGTPATGGQRVPFYRVIGLIWRPGTVLALSSLSFTALTAFLALHYQARGWAGAGTAMMVFVAGYVLVRLFFAHWPDTKGGAKVAMGSLAVQLAGQLLLWLAPGPAVALAGALLSGLGFSLIFPAMGVEATRRVPPSQRGQAVGNFVAFFDIALGLGGPLLGLVVVLGGSGAPFLAGALAILLSMLMVRRLPPALPQR